MDKQGDDEHADPRGGGDPYPDDTRQYRNSDKVYMSPRLTLGLGRPGLPRDGDGSPEPVQFPPQSLKSERGTCTWYNPWRCHLQGCR